MSLPLVLIGCGSVFDAIATDAVGYGIAPDGERRAAASVAALAVSVPALLEGLDPALHRIFLAVDQNALNYARLELYGAARLRGFRPASLVHARAWVAPDARVDDNVWVGPGVLVAGQARLGSDVLVSPGARIDAGAHIEAHGWIGAGASVGAGTRVGSHSVIGADVHLRAGLQIGRHCVLDRPGAWEATAANGVFSAPQFSAPARIIGAGYSHQKRS